MSIPVRSDDCSRRQLVDTSQPVTQQRSSCADHAAERVRRTSGRAAAAKSGGRPAWGFCALLLFLGVALAMNSALGPLWLETIKYHYSEAMTNQGIGLDAVALLLAAPIAVAAAVLVARRRIAGAVIAFAPAAFAAYMMPQYIVGPDYIGLPGNNERAIPFHLAVMVLAIAVMIIAWRNIGSDALPPDTARSDHRRSWVLIALAVFTAIGRWVPGFVDALSNTPSVTYLDNPTAFWLVGVLDLGLIVPAAIATAVALRRGELWCRKASYVIIGWFSLVPASVAAMAITMQVNDDPLGTTGNTIIMTTAGVVFTACAVMLYRPLFQKPR
jgi:hypothetical protein